MGVMSFESKYSKQYGRYFTEFYSTGCTQKYLFLLSKVWLCNEVNGRQVETTFNSYSLKVNWVFLHNFNGFIAYQNCPYKNICLEVRFPDKQIHITVNHTHLLLWGAAVEVARVRRDSSPTIQHTMDSCATHVRKRAESHQAPSAPSPESYDQQYRSLLSSFTFIPLSFNSLIRQPFLTKYIWILQQLRYILHTSLEIY